MEQPKIQSERLIKEQKLFLVQFMLQNSELVRQRVQSQEGRKRLRELWEKATEELNKLGPPKSVAKWQRVWVDLKNSSKKKASEIKIHIGGTGGGPPSSLKLSQMDEDILSLLSKEAVYGVSAEKDVPQDSAVPHCSYSPSTTLSSRELPFLQGFEGLSSREDSLSEGVNEPPKKKRKRQKDSEKANELTKELIETLKETNKELRGIKDILGAFFTEFTKQKQP